jgi:AhpD family alkylhydroperoxidase
MPARLRYSQIAAEPLKAMNDLANYLRSASIEPKLLNLVKLRASQINGCAYCIDMHSKDLLAAGESLDRLLGLEAWRESTFYSDRERAALEWTEAITLISRTHASDVIYDRVRPHFSDKELADLTWAIAAINLWNRLGIAFRAEPGHYRPRTQLEATTEI